MARERRRGMPDRPAESGRGRGRRWALLGTVLAATGSVLASCGGSTAVVGAPVAGRAVPAAPAPPPIEWSPCPSAAAIQCGSVPVPLDYRHPRGATIAIAVTRAPALDPSHRIGVLVVNPGGPGESGNQLLPVMLGLLPATIRRDFDVVSFDPRGTGASDRLGCGTAPSAVTSALPEPAPGRPLPGTPVFAAMAAACRTRAPALTRTVDTVDTARDMDRIRAALGVPTLSFYGLSYGTVLGATYAALFPHRVRTMVLDGAVDVNATLAQQAAEEAPAAEQALEHLFTTCATDPTCPLGAHPRDAFAALAARLARSPLPAPGHGDTAPVTTGDLDTAALFALSVPGTSGVFLHALASAEAGDGGPLRALALEFVTDTDGTSLVDAEWATICNDAAAHPGPAAAGALARSLAARDPLLGAYTVTYTLGGCVSWPAGAHPVTDVHPRGVPPVLVIGNTGDPNTPLVAARHLAAAIPGATELTWRCWGHTWLLSGPGDPCMQRAVTTYLTGGGPPARGTACG